MAQKSSKQRAEAEVLDLKSKLRQLNKAVAEKGASLEENAPLVDTIKAVEGLKAGGEELVLTLFKKEQFSYWPDEKFPPLKVKEGFTESRACFNRCNALKALPPIQGIEMISDFSTFASQCRSLEGVTFPDLIRALKMDNAFQECTALTSITIGAMPIVKSLFGAFRMCKSLTTITLGAAPKATQIGFMLQGCFNLESVTLDFSGGLLERFEGAFSNCRSLRTISGVIDVTAVSKMLSGMDPFRDCRALEDVRINGLKVSLDLASCQSLSMESVRYLVENAQTPENEESIHLNSALLDTHKEELDELGAVARGKGWILNYR